MGLIEDMRYWKRVSHEAQRKIEDEWLSCIKIWDFIENTTNKCKLPFLGPLENFHLLIKCCNHLKNYSKKKEDVQGISNVEKVHLKRFLMMKLKRQHKFKCSFPKMEKYI
jgi:hypothetical protein